MRLALLGVLIPALGTSAEIPQGAHVALHLINSVSTRTAREGDRVYFRTATPIVSQSQIVVPVGSYVTGAVAKVKRSGRVSGRAELAIRIDSLTLPSGQVIQVSPQLSSVDSAGTGQQVDAKEGQVKQGSGQGSDAARVATLGGAGAAIGGMADHSWTGAGIGAGAGGAVGLAAVLLTRGKEVDLRPGSTVDVVFERAVAVD